MAVNAHSDLVNKLLMDLSKIPGCRVWKNHTGVSFLENGSALKYGLPGSADITGILKIDWPPHLIGVRLEIECKTGTGKLQQNQILFKNMIEKHGGIYIEARDVQTVISKINFIRTNFFRE